MMTFWQMDLTHGRRIFALQGVSIQPFNLSQLSRSFKAFRSLAVSALRIWIGQWFLTSESLSTSTIWMV